MTRRRMSRSARTLLAAAAALLLSPAFGAGVAHAAYASEAAYVCGAESQPWPNSGSSTRLSNYSILHPGCGNLLSHQKFAEPAVDSYYRGVGFDRNFLLWAPHQVRGDLGPRKHAGCLSPHSNGSLCASGVGFGFSPSDDWNGPTSAKYWNGGFISLACGNFSETGSRQGPIPTISGTKYEDLNGNGARDGGEPGLSGVTIRLYRDGNHVATAVTGAGGSYSFALNAEANANLRPGTYTVEEDIPTGYRKTAQPGAIGVGYGAADHNFSGNDFGNQKVTDIRLVKTPSVGTVVAGTTLTWKLAVTNAGHFATPGVRVTDTLPAAITQIDQLDPACSVSGQLLTCVLGTMAAGETRELTFRTLVSAAQLDGPLANSATATSDWPDTHPPDNTGSGTTNVITRADLVASKHATPDTVDGGAAIDFVLGVRNDGPSYARDVVVTDTVPFQVEILSAPGCTISGQNVSCDAGDLPPGGSASFTIHGKARGVPVGTGGGHSHQLSVDKQDGYLAIDAGQTATLVVACPTGTIATDGSFHVEQVDQGTGTLADVRVVRAEATTPSAYTFEVTNGASGRAQGHGYVTCLSTQTTGGDGNHQHALTSANQPPVTDTYAVGQHMVDLPVDLDSTPIAPSFAVLSGAARLIGAAQTATGWQLTFDVTQPAQIRSSVRQLRNRTGTTNGHDHLLVFSHPQRALTAPPGASEASIDCGELEKGIVATFAGAAVTGHEPRPRTRTFWFYNPGSAPVDAEIDLLCIGVYSSTPVEPPGLLSNTVEVDSDTVDPDPSDNTATIPFVVNAAAGSVPPDPDGPVDTFAVAGPAAFRALPPAPAAKAAPPVAIAGTPQLAKSGRSLTVKFSCTKACTFTASLTSAAGRQLAARRLSIRAGRTKSVTFRVRAGDGARLRRAGGRLFITPPGSTPLSMRLAF